MKSYRILILKILWKKVTLLRWMKSEYWIENLKCCKDLLYRWTFIPDVGRNYRFTLRIYMHIDIFYNKCFIFLGRMWKEFNRTFVKKIEPLQRGDLPHSNLDIIFWLFVRLVFFSWTKFISYMDIFSYKQIVGRMEGYFFSNELFKNKKMTLFSL